MNKLVIFIVMFITCGICSGQNLVPNPGFENYDSLPCNYIENSVQFANMLHDWMVPNFTTPDICSPLISDTCNYGNPLSFNSAGLQTPRTGNIMVGMVCQHGGYNEYIQVPLITPLIAGNSYQAEMYVSLASKSDFSNNDIGMYFSDTLIADSNFQSTSVVPQILDTSVITDTLNWTLISGCFTATSTAPYLIIGNFFSACANGVFLGGGWPMAYYFFDDISVTPVPSCSSGQLTCTTGLAENESMELKIYPNPAKDNLNITANRSVFSTISIYDIASRKLIEESFINSASVNTSQLEKGMYIYEVRNKNSVIKKGKFIKD